MPRDFDGSEYIYFASQADAKNLDIFFTRKLRSNQPFQRLAIAPVHQVCSSDDEAHPWVSADHRDMYFSRKAKDGWRIGHAVGTAPRSFEKVTMLDLPVGFQHPSLSRDMLTMYVHGPIDEKRTGIFVVRRANRSATWGKPESVDVVNSKDGPLGERSPSLSPDGAILYFASDRPGGRGGMDLHYVPTASLVKKPN
jgi:hypothetical protein